MTLADSAKEIFMSGFSCSESIVRAAYDSNLIDTDKIDEKTLNMMASAFSGGIGGAGCLCGAVAGSEIILGLKYGRKDTLTPPDRNKMIAKSFVDKFKEKRKFTCCKALMGTFTPHTPECRKHCAELVADAAQILEEHIKQYS